MRCSVACPVCQTPLTFVKAPNALACPFCRAALKFADGTLPVGKKVQCSKCHGKFTAEAPPSGVCVSATTQGACPFCRTALDLPPNHPAGKRAKCPDFRNEHDGNGEKSMNFL